MWSKRWQVFMILCALEKVMTSSNDKSTLKAVYAYNVKKYRIEPAMKALLSDSSYVINSFLTDIWCPHCNRWYLLDQSR